MKTIILLFSTFACSAQVFIGTNLNGGPSFIKGYDPAIGIRPNIEAGYSFGKLSLSGGCGISLATGTRTQQFSTANGNGVFTTQYTANTSFVLPFATVGYKVGKVNFFASPSYDIALSSKETWYDTFTKTDKTKELLFGNTVGLTTGLDFVFGEQSQITIGANYYQQFSGNASMASLRVGYRFNCKK
jgi:hypothetical protein